MSTETKHVAVLGAGPVGLEAALALAEAGYPFTLYEAATEVAGNVAEWGHVRVFTPWEMNVSPRARRALIAARKAVPEGSDCPTGEELRERLLIPLAELPQIAPHLALGTRVLAVGREGLLKHEEIGSRERGQRPFRLLLRRQGHEEVAHADVVLDCTGSYTVPNPLGDGGIPAPGETDLAWAIHYRLPNLEGEAAEWAGKTILLVGAGHSGQTAARDLADLAEDHPGTRIIWALRSATPFRGETEEDPLPERAQLHRRAQQLAAGSSGAVEIRHGVAIESLAQRGHGKRIDVTLRHQDGSKEAVTVDRILALTGSVGDHTLYRQLQVHECYATSGPMKLAAALLAAGAEGGDCLTQASHGADTLKNPEPGFYILGSKSYGRNNTFLMRVGWEQVDEVMGLLAGG